MQKELDRMTQDELGRLFPIKLSEPDPRWPSLFTAEKKIIEQALGNGNIIRIEHIGSTAVPSLISKPTIDMLLEIPENTDIKQLTEYFEAIGYHGIAQPEKPAPHMMFAKGYTNKGIVGQTYHVHLRYQGDWDELYFRDYLRMNPGPAAEYARLKVELAKAFRYDRDGYTDAKTTFVKQICALARKKTGG